MENRPRPTNRRGKGCNSSRTGSPPCGKDLRRAKLVLALCLSHIMPGEPLLYKSNGYSLFGSD
jgi:hypothetical protein